MLVPMAVSRPDRVWFYATITPCRRWRRAARLRHRRAALRFIGVWLFSLYGLNEKAASFQASYAQYGHWVILLKA